MAVAVVTVWVVEPTIDEVIDVITVRNRLMTAARAVPVVGFVPITVVGRTFVRVLPRDRKSVFVHVIAVGVMQATIVQVIGMPVVPHGGMPAIGAVLMGVPFMDFVAVIHGAALLLEEGSCTSVRGRKIHAGQDLGPWVERELPEWSGNDGQDPPSRAGAPARNTVTGVSIHGNGSRGVWTHDAGSAGWAYRSTEMGRALTGVCRRR